MVNSVNSASSSSNTSNTTDKTKSLGKEDFLKLLVAQMENQDPMNPVDNTQSIAELAQFSSLEQMNNIASSIDTLNTSLSNYMQQSALTQGAAMIGKHVSGVATDGKTLIEGKVEAVQWLDGDPKLQVRKSDGSLVDLEISLITSLKEQSTDTSDSSAANTSNSSSTDAAADT